jgi:outer membrane lipoprotein carrier protein
MKMIVIASAAKQSSKTLKVFISSCIVKLLCVSTTAFAAPSDDLASLLNGIQTMRANFTQVVFDNRYKAVQTSYGRMSMQRPGKFRWEVTKPIPQVIVANTTRLWIYDPDLEQVTIRSLKQATGETPALLLSHVNVELNSEYKVSAMPAKANLTWYNLIPRKADSMFVSIQMGFLGNQIEEMRLQDHLGHVTQVNFKGIETNITLPASLFVFKAPPGVDVINETK